MRMLDAKNTRVLLRIFMIRKTMGSEDIPGLTTKQFC